MQASSRADLCTAMVHSMIVNSAVEALQAIRFRPRQQLLACPVNGLWHHGMHYGYCSPSSTWCSERCYTLLNSGSIKHHLISDTSPNCRVQMLMMGASMDGKLLQEAATTHCFALGSVDGKFVTSAADYQAVISAIG